MKTDIQGYLIMAIDHIARSKMEYQAHCIEKRIPTDRRVESEYQKAKEGILRVINILD